jgi:HAD superfamily hydrolase (TIGR01549 family)
MTDHHAKVIVFDLWNTLAYNDTPQNPMLLLERRLGLTIDQYKKIERPLMTRKFGSVLEASRHICESLEKDPDNKLIRDMLDIWDVSKIHLALFPDVIPELEKLRQKGYKIALISNTDCFTMRSFFEAGYRKHFDYMALSYETGLLKPDPGIFRLILENLGVKPGEAVMVGDNLKDDVQAALSVGMQAVLMRRNPEEFKFVPSWVEKVTYEKEIKDLKELEKFLI